MKLYDVVIVGAGVAGAAIARELSRYKLNIAVLEKEIECGFGVSKSNSGIIHPGTQNPKGSLKAKLCVEGNKLVRKLAKELGVDFKEVGELIVAFNEIKGKIKGDFYEFEQDKLKFAAYHGTESGITEALIYCGKYDVVLSGHTHILGSKKIGKTLAINPGTANGFGGKATVAIFDTENKNTEFIVL